MAQTPEDIVKLLYPQGNPWSDFKPDPSLCDPQGWNGRHPSLSSLNRQLDPQVIIDLGVWKGQSAITIAKNLVTEDISGTVIAIDTFLGSPEHWAGVTLFERLPGGRPDLLERFLNNVFYEKLCERVIPFPQTGPNAYRILRARDVKATLIHVDAAHEYSEVIQDLENFYQLLVPGGLLVGDDYHESWPGVVKAFGEFSARQGLPLAIQSPKAILRKPMDPGR